MQKSGVDLILFAGGDGTARDIYKAVGNNFPVLGVPAGVKIHSAVFGVTPKASGELAWVFLKSKGCRLKEAPVIDLDEKSYRKGKIITKLHGYLTDSLSPNTDSKPESSHTHQRNCPGTGDRC